VLIFSDGILAKGFILSGGGGSGVGGGGGGGVGDGRRPTPPEKLEKS